MFHKKHPPVGSRPGTLVVHEGALPPRVSAIQYTADAVRETPACDPAAIGPLAEEGVTWIDVQGLGDHAALRAMAERFSIHALALEDVVNVPQRPKRETYDLHEQYVSRMARLVDGRVQTEQVSIFVGKGHVLTFQEKYGDVLDPVRQRVRQGVGPIRSAGADYLAYAIIDTIIDYYYPVLDAISDELEELERIVIERASPQVLARINRLKHELLDLRRGIWPQRDAINGLVRGDSPYVCETVQLYLRDSYDHAVQVTEVIESYRDILAGLFGTYLSVVGNRTNDIMKVLTIMASIFIPLTFLAGIYGMNFDRMPELHTRWGYPIVLAAMFLTTAGMLWYFYRKGWIGGGSDGEEEE